MPTQSQRFLLRALLLTAAAVAVAWLPVRAWAGDAGERALFLAAGIAFAGALVGRLPRLLLLKPGRPDGPMLAAMAGIGARMLTTAAMAFAVVLADIVPRFAFAIPLVVIYLLLLVLEVSEAVAEIARGEAAPPPAPKPLPSRGGVAST